MLGFIQRHAAHVIGILSGLDRLRLRGTLRWLANVQGMRNYLFTADVLLKDFKVYVQGVTDQIREATTALAQSADRPVVYLHSSTTSKEQTAREIQQRDGVTDGLICVLSCVEPCWTYEVGPNRSRQLLELRGKHGKCLHYYFYLQDPVLGFMHARLQTWFPLTIHVCLNGREWLARQMDSEGISYLRQDNCFTQVANLKRAQKLLDQQLRVRWPAFLNRIVRQVHPSHAAIFRQHPTEYYWSAEESEWATDVMFDSPQSLAELYPRLIRHGIEHLGSPDVMRFLGRKPPAHGGVNGHFTGQVVSDLKIRPEGMRIKHRLNHNSIKMYDKRGSVLRVETTINDTSDLRVYRRKEGDSTGPKSWRRLRKGVADLRRRAQVSQAANERYLEAMAAVEDTQALGALAARLCRPAQWQGKRVRALNPLAEDDAKLLASISRGEFTINGFRNRDLRPLLYGSPAASAQEARRQSGAITRKLRLLRAHGLVAKVPKTHRYVLTAQGTAAITALLAARQADAAKLSRLAA